MLKTIETRNTKEITRMIGSGTYCIEGEVRETGRWNTKHAEYRFWFDGKSEWPQLVIRTRRTFHKRFSKNNQRISKFVECYIDPTDSKAIIDAVMDKVGISHDIEIEKEFLRN